MRPQPASFLAFLCAVTLAAAADLVHPWRADDRLRRVFTPAAMPPGTYRVFAVEHPIERVAAHYRRIGTGPAAEGSAAQGWRAERQAFGEAIGLAAVYDRAKVARLYGGRGPLVARGVVRREGVTEAVVLISPYPDASLSRLESGTMIVVFRVP